jgi:DNA-directed RNA polymerase specialized sigma24 family protein
MLPKIRSYARTAFGHLDPDSREDAVEETIANAAVAFARLVRRGKAQKAFPTVLAHYAITQVRQGRRVGSRLRIGEVLSSYAQRKKGFVVQRLDRFDRETEEWLEVILEDHRTPVPDQVAFRIDFPNWLAILSRRNRRIAEALALGNSTGYVARRFRLSAARISQLRGELYRSWQKFHGDPAAAAI